MCILSTKHLIFHGVNLSHGLVKRSKWHQSIKKEMFLTYHAHRIIFFLGVWNTAYTQEQHGDEYKVILQILHNLQWHLIGFQVINIKEIRRTRRMVEHP